MAAEAKETVSMDDAKAKNVLRQVEFYFSDSNLPRDNFLRKTVEESQDGLVSLALICSFGRMKSILGLDQTTKAESVPESSVVSVAEVLKNRSSTLRISDDGKRVGRIAELLKPEEVIEQVDSRTIAASPLPYDVQLENVESFFSKLAKVNSVRLPRHFDRRTFTGTALIEFSEEEDANRVMKENLVFEGTELQLKPKKDYDEEREEVMKVQKERHKKNHEESYQKGLIIAFKLTKKGSEKNTEAEKEKAESENEKAEGENAKAEGENANMEVENEKAEGESEKVEGENEQVEGENEKAEGENEKVEHENSKSEGHQISREDVQSVFGKFGTIKFIDFSRGENDGYIRYQDPEGGEKARAMAALSDQGGLTVKNYLATVEAVTGEDEKKYWAELAEKMAEKRDNIAQNKSHRGGRGGRYNNRGGRGSYGNKHGKRNNDSGDRRASKAQRVN
ncbi:hypothetical protein LUZ60_017532 [Juncus effusus]|nr:hypothetical protein LUZ60_017532 [Juncus effusus]